MPRDSSMHHPEWLLKRNCSLAPRQLAFAYGVLFLLSFSVAAAFGLRGLWYVPAFSLVEMSAVACALLHYARHAADYDRIALGDAGLLVEQVRAGRTRRTRFDLYWTRISLTRGGAGLIRLEAKGRAVDVGCYATPAQRRQLLRELLPYLPTHL